MQDVNSIAIVISFAAFFISAITTTIHFGQLSNSSKTLIQNAKTTKKSAELLSLLELHKLSTDIEFAGGLELISALKANSWEEFKRTDPEIQREIRMTIAHLNFVATLIFSEHLDVQSGWNTYFQPFRLVGKKLSPWWFDGVAEEFPNRYVSARRMMKYVLAYTDEDIADFDRQRELRLDRKFSGLRAKK